MLFRSTYARHRIRHGIRYTAALAGRRPRPPVPNERLRHMLIGYARVSKADGSQSLDLQRDALQAAGVDAGHVYHDVASGVRDDRPGRGDNKLRWVWREPADARGRRRFSRPLRQRLAPRRGDPARGARRHRPWSLPPRRRRPFGRRPTTSARDRQRVSMPHTVL